MMKENEVLESNYNAAKASVETDFPPFVGRNFMLHMLSSVLLTRMSDIIPAVHEV